MLPSLLGCATPVVLSLDHVQTNELAIWLNLRQERADEQFKTLEGIVEVWAGLLEVLTGITAGQRYLEAWASIENFQTSKVREGSGRFCRCLEGSRDFFKQKKTLSFRKSFLLAVSLTLPSVSRGFPFRRYSWRIVPMGCPPWHPRAQTNPWYPLGFPNKQGGYEMEGLDYPTLDPRQRPMSMIRVVFFPNKMIIATGSDCVFKISILEFWNEYYKIELLICFSF